MNILTEGFPVALVVASTPVVIFVGLTAWAVVRRDLGYEGVRGIIQQWRKG